MDSQTRIPAPNSEGIIPSHRGILNSFGMRAWMREWGSLSKSLPCAKTGIMRQDRKTNIILAKASLMTYHLKCIPSFKRVQYRFWVFETVVSAQLYQLV